MKKTTAILLLSCNDKPGIVSQISHFIASYGGNIIKSDQHSDEENNRFFMRIEWDLAHFELPREKIYQAFEPLAMKFKMKWRLEFNDDKAKVAFMVSRQDHCLLDLVLRYKAGELSCEPVVIISNHEEAGSIAQIYDIPFYYIPVTPETRVEAEKKILNILDEKKTDLLVLARYMQILSPEMVKAYEEKIINIHHSFLPAFIGAKPYHQAYERGVKIIGATSHYVTEDLDRGPIIEQDVTRISHRDSIEDLIQKGKDLEKTVLAKALKLHLAHKVLIEKNKTVVFQ